MKKTYKDLSKNKIDELYIRVLEKVDKAASWLDIEYIVVGAVARDIVLQYIFKSNIRRATRDFDLGIKISSWEDYNQLIKELIRDKAIKTGKAPHKLFYKQYVPIDIIPFGDIADNDNKISWPPEHETIMNIQGFYEAYENTLTVKLSDNPLLEIKVADLTSLALLKLISFSDRKMIKPSKDAQDLADIFDNYIDAGNRERLYEEHSDILQLSEFNENIATARLLGRDISKIATKSTLGRIIDILDEEIGNDGLDFISSIIPSGIGNDSEIEMRVNQLKTLRQGLEE